MLTSFADLKGRQVKPPSHWDPFRSAYPQVMAAVTTAAGLFSLATVFLPDVTRFAVQHIYAFLHEASHTLIAILGQGKITAISLDPTGGGHTLVSVSGPLHDVLVTGAGLVLPAWLSAWLLVNAITRQRIEATLLILGLATAYLSYRYIDATPEVTMSLYGFAGFCFLVAFLPTGGLIKATGAFLVAFVIASGVLQSLDYAWLQWIDNDITRPTDSQNIADRLHLDGIQEIALSLLILMGLGYSVAGLLAWNWLQRYRD